jgi:hypothetical protein
MKQEIEGLIISIRFIFSYSVRGISRGHSNRRNFCQVNENERVVFYAAEISFLSIVLRLSQKRQPRNINGRIPRRDWSLRLSAPDRTELKNQRQ